MVKIKDKIKKYGFFVVACLMLAACVISGTMAKFASSSDGSGLKITVATWNVKVEGTTLGSIDGDGNPVKIDLSGLAWQILWRSEEDGISDSLPQLMNVCAPGTWGYAPITITNHGDVYAAVTVTETTGSAFLPEKSTPQAKDDPGRSSPGLQFGVTKEELTESDEPTEFQGISSLGEIVVPPGEEVFIYVYYVWELAAGKNDTQDTALGKVQDWFDFGQLTFTAVQAKNTGSTD